MVEPRWEMKIGSPVMATDGEYGRLQQLILDQRQGLIIALLVRRHGLLPTRTVVIPREMVTDASEKELLLNLALDQVDALPEYSSESDGADLKPSVWIMQGDQTLYDQDDQPAGRVSLILMNPGGQVIGVVMQVGILPRRNLIVPTSWIQATREGKVHLTVENNALDGLPEYRPDEILEVDVDNALWSDEVLRNTDYYEIGVDVQDGVVILRGHVFNTLNKDRAEEATRSITGILQIENCLVVDQELATEVAQAVATLQLTPSEYVSFNAQHGFITLTGQVNNTARREAAGVAAASLPQVRGVANFLRAPDAAVLSERQKFWQPRIGEMVDATDMQLGYVEQVVINPNNRRVTGFVTRGSFPMKGQNIEGRFPDETSLQERDVVLPVHSIRFDGGSSVQLLISGAEAARNPDVASSDLVFPPVNWQPPYPYKPEDVLFDKECSGKLNGVVTNQSYF